MLILNETETRENDAWEGWDTSMETCDRTTTTITQPPFQVHSHHADDRHGASKRSKRSVLDPREQDECCEKKTILYVKEDQYKLQRWKGSNREGHRR